MNISALAAGAAVSNMGQPVDRRKLTELLASNYPLESCLHSLVSSLCESQEMFDDFVEEGRSWIKHINKNFKTEEKQLVLFKMIK